MGSGLAVLLPPSCSSIRPFDDSRRNCEAFWYQAGVAFAQLYRDHHATVGLPSPSPRSVAGLLINEGIFGASPSEPVLEVIEKVKRRFGDATSVLDACDREQRMSAGKRPTLLVYRVICTDEDAMRWGEEDLGSLRVALNALVRVFRL